MKAINQSRLMQFARDSMLAPIVILFVLFTGITIKANAQQGFYVPPDSRIFFAGDSATIFSDVYNVGEFRLGKTAVLLFKGYYWLNDPLSVMTDENGLTSGSSGGGLISFLAPDRLPGTTGSLQQMISGGYNAVTRTGPMFSNLRIDNPAGVRLYDGSLKVRHKLDLLSGHLFTSDNIIIIGDKYPGVIAGYNENRFIVTDGQAGTGLLLREGVKRVDGNVAFPVGSNVKGYAPASVYLKNDTSDDFYVHVSDAVFANAFTGAVRNAESVNKTWQIGKIGRPGKDEVSIRLQHHKDEEGLIFERHRLFSYISRYTSNGWDTALFKVAPDPLGLITTGAPLSGHALNNRTFAGTVGAQSYFTKLAYPFADSARTNIWVTGFRLNSELVKIAWSTRPEVNIRYFVVQRRLDHETTWRNIDSMDSRAVNGYSFSYLNYTLDDANKYSGTSYYRIVLVDYQGGRAFSDIIVVDGQSKPSRFAIWPNPSTGRFMISIDKLQRIRTVVIWNAIGQQIRRTDVMGQELIEMYIFTPGTYIVGFVSDSKLIESRKLVITGW